jgi:hypothetical protein
MLCYPLSGGGGVGGGIFVRNCSLEIEVKDLVINRKLIFRWILKKYILRAGISFIVVVIGFGGERLWAL